MNMYIKIMIFTVFSAMIFYFLGYFLSMPILTLVGNGCVVVTALVLLAWVFKLLFPNAFSSKKDNDLKQ